MAEKLTEALFNTQYAGLYRTVFGRLTRWVIEAGGEDLAGGDLPAFLAAVAWNAVHRLNKRFGWSLKPWEVAGYILDLLALILKEAEHRIDIPKGFLTTYTLAMGIGVDAGFGGLVDGARIRARIHLENWSRAMAAKSRELKNAGQKMTQEHRREIIGARAFDSAEKFLNSGLELSDGIDGDKAEKATEDATPAKPPKETVHVSVHAKIAEMQRASEAHVRARGEELEQRLVSYQARDVAQSAVVFAASVDGRLAVERAMAALEESTATMVTDPVTNRNMTAQEYALLRLYREITKMSDDKKPEEGDKKKEEKKKSPGKFGIKGIFEVDAPDPEAFYANGKAQAAQFEEGMKAAHAAELAERASDDQVVPQGFAALHAALRNAINNIWKK